ncbi:MAG: DNA polymerase IV [Deltaproteobacteria bacterium]|nr:MAG: DNA polymerase IV [Deltaproteobacteria bacterium]
MILHIDMDAFYASVELLDNPELKGKCVIVGGTTNRGVVSAANYAARKYGVHSAMPIFQAKHKCPHGIFLRPRFGRYKQISRKIMSTLKNFTPLVEPVSIDEAYMDISGCNKLHGSPEEIGIRIKETIRQTLGLTCSIGIAPNKFLAKIASDMEKPDGLTVILPEKALEFIDKLPIQKVPGVGKKTSNQLTLLGITRLGDVKKFPEKLILDRLGKYGQRLLELAVGIDETAVIPFSRPKSVSSEHTLSQDTRNRELLNKYLLRHCEDVAKQLRKLGLRAKTVTLKLKHADFKQVTRNSTLTVPIQTSDKIYHEASRLLARYPLKKQVRLIGVAVSVLVSEDLPIQLSLFGEIKKKNDHWQKVDRTLDSIAQKFGNNAIRRASLSKKNSGGES